MLVAQYPALILAGVAALRFSENLAKSPLG